MVTPINLADVARAAFPAVPVLAYGPPIALETLDATGADDYLVEPWSGEELRFRLSRLCGTRSARLPGGVLSWGRYWISGGSHRADLTPHAWRQLDVLLRDAGETVSREVLSAVGRVGAYDAADERSVGMQVSRLRARLAVATADWAVKPRIVAVRGRGFSVRPG
ncbi:MAG TPA: winged helix-turn-helix domain-containing protein [Thermoanaerobaculia bacterium]|nr:winged helix-turn-helix domain-containing protein [Thermoanaerobaculia bacterium]